MDRYDELMAASKLYVEWHDQNRGFSPDFQTWLRREMEEFVRMSKAV